MKKIIIIILIVWGLFIFYRKFVAPIVVPFFKNGAHNVDLFGYKTSLDKTSPHSR